MSELQERLWDYEAVEAGQQGPATVVTLTPAHIAEYRWLYTPSRFDTASRVSAWSRSAARSASLTLARVGTTHAVGQRVTPQRLVILAALRPGEHLAADETGDRGLSIWSRHSLVRTAYATGDYQTAASVARDALDGLAGYPADEPRGLAVLTPVMRLVPSATGERERLLVATGCWGALRGRLGAFQKTTIETNIFTLNNLSTSVQAVAKGVIIVVAVLLQQRLANRST